MLKLLEKVAGKPRRELRVVHGPYAEAVLASRPQAYWRLEDIQGSIALDSTKNARHATYEGGVAFYLPGPSPAGLSAGKSINRAVHFAGGLLKAKLDGTGDIYSIELWFWDGLPADDRPIAGYLLSCGSQRADAAPGDQVGIGGTQVAPRRLIFSSGNTSGRILAGKTEITPKTWHHLALVRERAHINVYLDGNPEPEIAGEAAGDVVDPPKVLLVGGRGDGVANFEGKIDEVALHDRALAAAEVARHFRAASAR